MGGGGKACLYKHFGGAKALFYYINLQVNDSVESARPCKMFHWGEGVLAPCPLQVRACTIILQAYLISIF